MKIYRIITLSVAAALALCACSKTEEPGVDSELVKKNIIGKWKTSRIDGAQAMTNDRSVVTYEANGKASRNGMSFNWSLADGIVTERNSAAGVSHIFESRVSSMGTSIFEAHVKHTRNGEVASDSDIRYTKVAVDFSKDIVGLWEYVDSDHRLEFKEDGTYVYYNHSGKKWVKNDDIQNEYFVDGDWLALSWKDASGKESHEWWDISACNESTMAWTSELKNENGHIVKSEMRLKRIQPGEEGVPFLLASYNIRYDSKDDTGNKDWSVRKSLVTKLVKEKDFDVCAFVEVTQPGMRNDLKSLLGDTYTIKLCGRGNGADNGEAVGFGFKTDKFTMEKSGFFYLNSHPDKAGEPTEWADPAVTPYGRNRIAVWGLLKDKESGKQMLYMATHFELNKGYRAGSAKLMVAKAKELAPEGVPVFVCGDLNTTQAETSCYGELCSYFYDAYASAVKLSLPIEGGQTTFNDFVSGCSKDISGKRIDYIFYYGDNVILRQYGVCYDVYDGVLPSDHYPIYVNVELK